MRLSPIREVIRSWGWCLLYPEAAVLPAEWGRPTDTCPFPAARPRAPLRHSSGEASVGRVRRAIRSSPIRASRRTPVQCHIDQPSDLSGIAGRGSRCGPTPADGAASWRRPETAAAEAEHSITTIPHTGRLTALRIVEPDTPNEPALSARILLVDAWPGTGGGMLIRPAVLPGDSVPAKRLARPRRARSTPDGVLRKRHRDRTIPH
jgi:hypothetical protein